MRTYPPALLSLGLLVACGHPGPTAREPEPVPIADLEERSLEPATSPDPNPPAERPTLPLLTGAISPRLHMTYDLVRHEDWLVSAAQGGVIVWEVTHGEAVAAHETSICTVVVVALASAWAGCDKQVVQWNAHSGWTTHLENEANDATYYQLTVTPTRSLIASYGNREWELEVGASGFAERRVNTFGGARDAIFYRGEPWKIMSGISGPAPIGHLSIGSAHYPGEDPRRFTVDARDRLWVVDFRAGLFFWDGQRFVHEPGLNDKGSGVAHDATRDRLWMLHYTDGLTIKEHGRVVGQVEVPLGNLRDIELDEDGYGTVWVGGWRGIARVRWDGTNFVLNYLRYTGG